MFPERVEILVRVHDNDDETLQWASTRDKKIRVVIGDTEDGYGSLHKFINCLAAVSNGDWLWCGSDDVKMITQNWDSILQSELPAPKETCRIVTAQVVNMPNTRTTIISRAFYNALGHCGLTPHCDCYIDALAHFAGIRVPIGIQIQDMHTDSVPYVVPRDVEKTWAEYRSQKSAHCFNMDKLKLGAILKKDLGNWTTSHAPENP